MSSLLEGGPEGSQWEACFFTTKHSWRGKYKRIFCIGKEAVATLNPSTFEETNRWTYAKDFCDITTGTKTPNDFVITVKKKDSKKTNTMTFSAEFRTELLTVAQQYRHRFYGASKQQAPIFPGFKQHWSETRKDVLLSVRPTCIAQVNSGGEVLASYDYKDIEAILFVKDYPGGFVVVDRTYKRLHMFALEKRDQLVQLAVQQADKFVGVALKKKKQEISLNDFRNNRLGTMSKTEADITSLAEFTVTKLSRRHPEPVQRLLCLTETCLVERDPASYAIVTLRPLDYIFSIVRDPRDPQLFRVEYSTGHVRSYFSTDRDPLLASLLDSVRATGNKCVCVQMTPTDKGERFQPLTSAPDEEVESSLLKFIASPNTGMSFQLAVRRFNANVDYAGLVHAVTEEGWFKENKEKLIMAALNSLLEQGDQTDSPEHMAGEFLAIRRLFASKAGFHAFTQLPSFRKQIGNKVIKALQMGNDGVTYAALDMLCTLMIPMHDNYDIAQEKLNKSTLLASKSFLGKLLALLKQHADAQTGALVVSMLLDLFTFALGSQYSETTSGDQFDVILRMVSDLGRSLFALFEHPSLAIVKAAGLLMKAIIEEGDPEMCDQMQALALAEGALLRHLYTALYTKSTDNRMLTHRQLSRHLVALWTEKNPTAEALLARMFPAGLLDSLKSDEKVPERDIDRVNVRDNIGAAKQQHKQKAVSRRKLDQLLLHWRSRSSRRTSKQEVPTLRRRRQRVQVDNNWELFYHHFERDHARADLIWNYKTREELKECIDNEMRAFLADKDLRGSYVIAWNHTEFEVRYETLAEEVKIGDHYLRLLLENDPSTSKIHNAPQFFNDLYHRFLLTTRPKMKSMCLQAMAVVYKQCSEEIGHFNDTEFIVHMLNNCEDNLERDRLLQFLDTLLLNRTNVKLFIDAGGMRCLVDLVTLAHLHSSRTTTPMQTLMIEASKNQLTEDEPEWFYTKTDVKSKTGPLGFSELQELYAKGEINKETRVWAQGLEGWKPLRLIPQLKWTLVAGGTPVLDFSQLCILCLDMLTTICEYYPSRDADGAVIRPLPRCKRMLSDTLCLPHIVQLLLTFEPAIVERTARLLSIIMQDNTSMPRLYLTGVFFFIMMYTGSNLLPIARFLRDTHNYQAYKSDQNTGRSILGAMIPKAMVCFLDNHGPEKFASTFLGEFDTPEAIWGSEMRRMLIEKIAVHLSDFSPRLKSNTRAIYQYCPIPKVSYPQLEDELFCGMYYLRHLCDEQRFPDWPIKDHIELLKDILEAWKEECEKKPQSMTTDEAYKTLGLDPGAKYDQRKVRKAYFKMSMKYHPDKNPEGRDMFEKVNKAYEFVSSKENRTMDGPNPENIVLILRAQSILFKRHSDILQPYKYAGYPMLTVTIERETADENLFSSSVSLLNAACELSYQTVRCSPLNATEMMRQDGFEKLAAAFSRCLSVVGHNADDDEPAVQVCTNIVKCFAAAAAFDECRERISSINAIVKDVCRCLWVEGAPGLTAASIECVCAFSVDQFLQTNLIQHGAMWHIMQLLFGYDYTLEESDIEKDESTHQQEFVNKNAKVGVRALAMLAGAAKETPANREAQDGLRALLTPFLAAKLAASDPKPFLKLFNGNTENPYLIWDNSTRAELSEFLEAQQESVIKTGEQDPALGSNTVYSAHDNEVVVDDIFVRVYNEQPNFPIAAPERFTRALLDFVGTKAQYVWSATATASSEGVDEEKLSSALKAVALALESLRNVITANAGVEKACVGHFKLLFSLLKQKSNAHMQLMALQVISKVTANRACVKDIAASNVLVFLLFTLVTLPKGRTVALEALHALVSNNKCIEQLLQRGGIVYLLDLFCSSNSPVVRQNTATLFAKMLADKLHGPRIRITLSKFLPPIFLEAVRDNAEASVSMFESNQENPELIWGDEAREKVQRTVSDMLEDLFQRQQSDPELTWTLPPDFEPVYESLHGEVVVGGVFLRLLIAQPTWSFRKPKEFVVALMDKFMALLSKEAYDDDTAEQLKTVAQAAAALFRAQPDLANGIPAMGHLHKMMSLVERDIQPVQNAALLFFNQLASNSACVRAFASIECVPAFKKALSNANTEYLPHGCEMVMKIYEKNVPPLVHQALEHEFVDFLLELLKSGLDLCEHASACKAHVVKALKAMERDLARGEEVHAILDRCPWWASYKEQRHDLFITSAPTAGYLTGPTASVAGYLTAGPQSTAAMDTAPPDMIDDDDRSHRAAPGNPDA